jgi:3D (Asp-Asp-Asp) domain-containing protein
MVLPIRVTVTCYNSDPAQTDSTPFITAFNWKVRPGIIAVSIDLLEAGYVPGSKVYIKDFGVFTVGDIMNDRFSNHVDIWVPEDVKVFKYDDVLMVPVLETA